mmetsp:Transcript_3179/g.7190  ORF Transcript_3179/g.7190 Transcript_3179/m.7190 type:complete len:201 (-) Transcript_3179:784-1386(-)
MSVLRAAKDLRLRLMSSPPATFESLRRSSSSCFCSFHLGSSREMRMCSSISSSRTCCRVTGSIAKCTDDCSCVPTCGVYSLRIKCSGMPTGPTGSSSASTTVGCGASGSAGGVAASSTTAGVTGGAGASAASFGGGSFVAASSFGGALVERSCGAGSASSSSSNPIVSTTTKSCQSMSKLARRSASSMESLSAFSRSCLL